VSDPDVEHAGWATAGPGSRLRRRRSPLLGLLAAVLLLGGVGGAVAGIVQLALNAGPSEEEIEARGVVAGLDGPDARLARFTAPSERSYTVWLDLGDVRQVNRDQVVAATACEARGAGGSVATFRGSRQGSSVEIGSTSTVGTFSVPEGRTVVGCRQFPFGRRARRGRLREERPFLVARGKPSAGTGGFVLLFGGLAAALLAVPLGIRWYAGRLIERA
jgi:hypothetical protein